MMTAAVLGAGSWGTALAIQLSRNGYNVIAWDCDAELISSFKTNRCNTRYLPDSIFPKTLSAEEDLTTALSKADFILIAVPSYAMRAVCKQLSIIKFPPNLVWATKGFEKESNMMMHEVIEAELGNKINTAILSGPSFAKEVADNLPTAVTLASGNSSFAEEIANYFHSDNFRVYISDDIIGVELGGTIKNVLAIAAGISDGLGYGANARAALITRGLAEMMRLGQALNANPKTLMGLAGMGDLVLTCTDDQSRNRRLGLALSQGKTAQQYMQELGQAVEGFHAAQAVHQVAVGKNVEMPICEQVWRVLKGEMELNVAISDLLGRDMKKEFS